MPAFIDRTTFLIIGLAALAFAAAYQKTGAVPWTAMRHAGGLFAAILPKLAFGILLGALVIEALPAGLVEAWLSDQSGWRGIALGWVAGSMLPMGAPFVLFPVAAGLLKGGAGIGPVVTLLTASAVFGPMRVLAYEIPIMGTEFFLVRAASVLWMPPAAGLLAQTILRIARGG